MDLLETFTCEQDCIDHLTYLLWDNNIPDSPFIKDSKVYVCSNNRYKCKDSGKYFNVKKGTIFEGSRIPLRKWFVAIYFMTSHKKGISSVQLAKDIGVTQKTSWFTTQRIRIALCAKDNVKLSGTIEIDESFIGGSLINKSNKESQDYRGVRSKYKKTIVLGMLERGGEVRTMVLDKMPNKNTLPDLVGSNIEPLSRVYTDAASVYRQLGKELGYDHKYVFHGKKEYVRGDVHINSLEGYWSLYQRGIFGIYHFTSKKHQTKYLDEFSFRYNTRTYTDSERFDLMLCKTECGQVPYKELIETK